MEIETNMLDAEQVTAESTTIEEVTNFNNLTKQELVRIVEQQKQAIENYRIVRETSDENHAKELADCTDYYNKKIKELTSLLKYYERKFKLLGDILNIETGGEK